jgi:ATP-dependent phosphoenolpyruvate carboxykinase
MFVFEGRVGSDSKVSLPVSVMTDMAWQCVFANNMFIKNNSNKYSGNSKYTVIVVNNLTLFSEFKMVKILSL